jgi:hypothetical protein
MAEEELSGFPIKGIRLSRANLLWTFIDWSATPRGIKLLKSRCGWHLYGIPALAAVRLGTFASMITRDMIRWQYSLQTLPR